ncbi:MAG TPA: hypothetical protein VNJ01_09830 [Bacteriovoracaceae bacterium]|nr:hypothetical protein [Bacteriovoracaceae bacterium]
MAKVLVVCMFIILSGCMEKPSELVFEEKQIGRTSGGAGGTSGGQGPDRELSLQSFKTTVYPIVRNQTCVNCHSSQTKGQSPVFADADPEKAFDAITLTKRVDLINPEASRIVMKISGQSHNCWTTDCSADSNTMLSAVKEWAKILPVVDTGAGFFTSNLPVPADSTKKISQTEHGTVLLQAEQPLYNNEVLFGRFVTEQQSSALDGKYMILPAPESNPGTVALRKLEFPATAFNECKEFPELTEAERLKFMQQRVHIPSGITSGSKIVNDGHRPFSANLGLKIVRPDKRIEYARMLFTRDFSNLKQVLLYDGAPVAVSSQTPGIVLPDTYSGKPVFANINVNILPHFAKPADVYLSNGSFVQSGTFTRDDGAPEQLYNLFKEGIYTPSATDIHRNLLENGALKRNILYFEYRKTISQWFYSNNVLKSRRDYPYDYNKIYQMNVRDYFLPKVRVTLQCPNEPVNPNEPVSGNNPLKNCSAEPNYLRFHVVSDSGVPLVQDNALQCMTLNSSQNEVVPAPSSTPCDNGSVGFFHYMDLFAHFGIFENSSYGKKDLFAMQSNSPSSYQDLEEFTADAANNITLNNPNPGDPMNQDATPGDLDELDPDVFFAGGGKNVSSADNLESFRTTLHQKLLTTRCASCHGNGTATAPQFATGSPAGSLSILESRNFINFSSPSSSFRNPGMIHNCIEGSTDPKLACSNDEALKNSLIQSITAWKTKNDAIAANQGQASFRSLSAKERLPGRAKYRVKITEDGNYNFWAKIKKVAKGTRFSYRILDPNGNPVRYFVGVNTTPVQNGCYSWNLTTSNDAWEWTSPGREAEDSAIDQKGYLRLNDQKQPLPLANKRLYYPLGVGDHIIDIIGTSEDLKIDALGLNKVKDMTVESRLSFQPDRISVDEKNISDYKRKIMRFDLSTLLRLPSGKKAFFEVEVKKDFNNQNFIFRNPRFETIPRSFNVKVQGIKVYINSKHNYPDATYNNFEAVVGDNKVLTHAPLVALTEGADDLIKFRFNQLSVTTEALTFLYPKGTPPAPITDRRCNDLEFFIKNVKPILRNSKMMLNQQMTDHFANFPGTPRRLAGMPEVYNCVSCHTVNHPYFKMATFTNDEEFCREAISRVDFQNFYQSLVIRGINGTGNHPKFVFVEKFINGSDGNFKVHDEADDYLAGRQKVLLSEGGVSLAAASVPGPWMLWSRDELGISSSDGRSFGQLSADEQGRIKLNGTFRAIEHKRINMDVVNYVWYKPDQHSNLIFDANDPSVPDNFQSALDVIIPNGGRIDNARDGGPRVIYSIKPLSSDLMSVYFPTYRIGAGSIPLKANLEPQLPNAEPSINFSSIDYISTTPQQNTRSEMTYEYEVLRDYYREKVIDWIRRENAKRNE